MSTFCGKTAGKIFRGGGEINTQTASEIRKEAVPLDGERCPCCGREVASFLYLRGGEVVGCDGCVAAWDLWELPQGQEPEGRWENGRTA